jgi:GT2 family glycosyltransferase
MTQPLSISVVTPSFNSQATLERTLLSLLDQGYPRLECLVVDAGSTDGTLEILRSLEGRGVRWTSETDGGIADAFNKGVAVAQGELVAILNSDDWHEPGAIAAMAAAHERRLAMGLPPAILHGDMLWHEANRSRLVRPRLWGGRHALGRAFWFDMPLCHPTCFVPREVYRRVGLFKVAYRVAMDYEWALRAFQSGEHFEYVPRLITHFQGGGASGRNTRLAITEVRRAQRSLKAYPLAGRFAYIGKLGINRLKAIAGMG